MKFPRLRLRFSLPLVVLLRVAASVIAVLVDQLAQRWRLRDPGMRAGLITARFVAPQAG